MISTQPAWPESPSPPPPPVTSYSFQDVNLIRSMCQRFVCCAQECNVPLFTAVVSSLLMSSIFHSLGTCCLPSKFHGLPDVFHYGCSPRFHYFTGILSMQRDLPFHSALTASIIAAFCTHSSPPTFSPQPTVASSVSLFTNTAYYRAIAWSEFTVRFTSYTVHLLVSP